MSHTPEVWKAKFEYQAFDGDPADGTAASAFAEGWVELPSGYRIPIFYDENTESETWLSKMEALTHLVAAAPQLKAALEALADAHVEVRQRFSLYLTEPKCQVVLDARAALKAAGEGG